MEATSSAVSKACLIGSTVRQLQPQQLPPILDRLDQRCWQRPAQVATVSLKRTLSWNGLQSVDSQRELHCDAARLNHDEVEISRQKHGVGVRLSLE